MGPPPAVGWNWNARQRPLWSPPASLWTIWCPMGQLAPPRNHHHQRQHHQCADQRRHLPGRVRLFGHRGPRHGSDRLGHEDRRFGNRRPRGRKGRRRLAARERMPSFGGPTTGPGTTAGSGVGSGIGVAPPRGQRARYRGWQRHRPQNGHLRGHLLAELLVILRLPPGSSKHSRAPESSFRRRCERAECFPPWNVRTWIICRSAALEITSGSGSKQTDPQQPVVIGGCSAGGIPNHIR